MLFMLVNVSPRYVSGAPSIPSGFRFESLSAVSLYKNPFGHLDAPCAHIA